MMLILAAAACRTAPNKNGNGDGGNYDKPDGGPPPNGVCATEHTGANADGDTVTFCDSFFAERPFVRPPADDKKSSGVSTLYVAAMDTQYANLVDRQGTIYAVVGSDGHSATSLPAGLRAPSYRHQFLIYLVSGTVGTTTDPNSNKSVPSIQLTTAKPAILLEGKQLDGVFLGGWEGQVSKRLGDNLWDSTALVPIRITFTSLDKLANFMVWNDANVTLPDGERYAMVGAVDNRTSPVKASDGTCYPALSSYGDGNPLFSATSSNVRLLRYPAMHGPGEDELSFEYPEGSINGGFNGMDWANNRQVNSYLVIHPAGMLQAAPTGEWVSIAINPHGSPNGNLFKLHPVVGGGGACN